MAATLPKSTEELTQTGKGLIGGVADYINGSSARKVGLRYLFGDLMVMASAGIMGNWSKLSSGFVAVFQSLGFFADGEKNKAKILTHVTSDIDNVLNKASAALAGETRDTASTLAALQAASPYDQQQKLRHWGANHGVEIGQASMVGAGGLMAYSGLFGRHHDEHGGIVWGELLNGVFNAIGFGLPLVMKGHEKPEGYDKYKVDPDSHLPGLLRGIANGLKSLVQKPKESLSVFKNMLHYDPSEVSKYILSTTSLWGLLGGTQELLRADNRSRAAGVVQLIGSGCYLWGELAMGNMSQEKLHSSIGSNMEHDMAMLTQAGFFHHIVDKAIAGNLLREGEAAHNRQILDSIADEVVATRHQVKLDSGIIKQGLQEAMPKAYQDFSVDGARS